MTIRLIGNAFMHSGSFRVGNVGLDEELLNEIE